MEEFDFSKFPALKTLDVTSSLITKLDVSALPGLAGIVCDECESLATIDFGDKKHARLAQLICYGCPSLTKIDISYCPVLIDYYLKYKDKDNKQGFEYDDTLTEIIYDRNIFHSKALMLSGTLGMYFNMRLSADDEEEFNTLYGNGEMSFTVSGQKQTVPVSQANKFTISEDGKEVTLYGFRCGITSIQMADEISAVFTYGDGQTAEDTYTVRDYLDALTDWGQDENCKMAKVFPDEIYNLACAIEDYGHCAQLALSQANNWVIGEKYAEMPKAAEEELSGDNVIIVADGAVKGIASSDYTSKYEADGSYREFPDMTPFKPDDENTIGLTVKYALNLEANTTLEIVLSNSEDNAVTVTDAEFADDVTDWDGGSCTFEGNTVKITDIPAHELATARKVSITTDKGTLTISNLSALSYAAKIIDASDDEKGTLNTTYGNGYYDKLKNAVTALYHYYDKTKAYREKTDVYNQYN